MLYCNACISAWPSNTRIGILQSPPIGEKEMAVESHSFQLDGLHSTMGILENQLDMVKLIINQIIISTISIFLNNIRSTRIAKLGLQFLN